MHKLRTLLLLGALALGLTASAQVPQLLNYQGRVAVGTVNFDGNGQFKFALVNANGTVTYWSNDGTSTAGSQPNEPVTLAVNNGLYSVLLGDATLVSMTAIPASVFNNSDVRLRVWFNDRADGFQQLAPDQRIAAVGYAIIAGNVPDGAITTAKIAAGAVGSAQLASGAAAANLNASGQSGVPSSGLVLSATDNNAALLNAGYVKMGATGTVNLWQQRTVTGSPPAWRKWHTAVWTGTEMIVWGGSGNSYFNDGGRYNPATDTWTSITTSGAPVGRDEHTAVWTGTTMIVWGGYRFNGTTSTYYNDGGRYNPAGDSWTAMSSASVPAARLGHTAVWTGSEMIVWGGYNGSSYFNSGGRYNPTANTWTATTTTGAPAVRYQHTAVWTGSEMIVWGGDAASVFNDGARYNPVSNSWTATATLGAPAARFQHTAVWTGNEMIIWGGNGGGFTNEGARYNPTGNTWTTMSTMSAPSQRTLHTAVWTGADMVVWGGSFGSLYFGDGGRYNPASNTWVSDTTFGPAPRAQHAAVWTGTGMIVWGGVGTSQYTDTFIGIPGRVLFLYQKP